MKIKKYTIEKMVLTPSYILIGDTKISKDYFVNISKNFSICEITKVLPISQYRCKKIFNYYHIQPKKYLGNGVTKKISFIDNVLTYYDNDGVIRKISKDDVIKYYHTDNHTDDETSLYFNVDIALLKKYMSLPNKPRKLTLVHNRKTCLEKYGDPTYNNQTKIRQTNLKKYGCENVFQVESIKQTSYSTKLERYGNEHFVNPEQTKKTCLERYGVVSPMQTKEVQEKAKQTCLKHFGVEYPMQSKEVQDKYNFEDIGRKVFETKLKNGTTNTSKPQKYLISELKKIFGDNQILSEYKDDRYPYYCDIYIKSLDMFVELNLFFTHGGHQFNRNNNSDILKLEKWEIKSKTSNFYKNAIKVWTISDPEKYDTAQKNELNYIMLYSEKALYEFIDNLKEKYKNEN